MTTGRSPNLAALLAEAARRRPDHPALVWDGGTLSWRDLEARAAALARRLAREGVGAGDVVALERGEELLGLVGLAAGGHPEEIPPRVLQYILANHLYGAGVTGAIE